MVLEPRFILAMAQQHEAEEPWECICASITSNHWVLRESTWMFRVIRMAVVRIHVPQYVMINRHVNSHNPQLFPIYLARSKGQISYYNSFSSHVKLQTIHDWYNMIDESYDDYNPFWGWAMTFLSFISIYYSLFLFNSYLVISVIN